MRLLAHSLAHVRAGTWVVVSSVLLACSSSSSAPSARSEIDAGGDGDAGEVVTDAGVCGVTIRHFDSEPEAVHVPIGTPIAYPTNPPTGGNHYPIWVTWGAHATVLPAGHWVHNLEHGGVAFLYRCASRAACPELAAKVEAVAAALPLDPKCTTEGSAVHARIVVLPDPDLPDGVQVAAAAWGWSLVGRCLDDALLRQFYLDHVGRAPAEDFCGQGSVGDDTTSDAGADAAGDATASDAALDADATP